MKHPNGIPGLGEYGKLRSYLAKNGVSQAQINEVVPNGSGATMKRAEIVEALKAMCHSF